MLNGVAELANNKYDLPMVFQLAFFSRLAYTIDHSQDNNIVGDLGLTSLTFNRVAGQLAPQWCLVKAWNVQVLCIAGTTDLAQWMNYVTQAGVDAITGLPGQTFRPFEAWSETLMTDVQGTLDAVQPLYLCGHSMGGAMAILCGEKLRRRGFLPRRIFTFGCPRIGNEIFCDGVLSEVRNVRRPADPVPSMPPPIGPGAFAQIGAPDVIPELFRPGLDLMTPREDRRRMNLLDFVAGSTASFWLRSIPTDALTGHQVDRYLLDVWSMLSTAEQKANGPWLFVTRNILGVNLTSKP